MAKIIHKLQKLSRVREELKEVVGFNRRVEEYDIDHLPYLHAHGPHMGAKNQNRNTIYSSPFGCTNC